MSKDAKLLPAPAIQGMGSGLLLMAFFTTLWSIIAFVNLGDSVYKFGLPVFWLLAVIFTFNGVKLFSLSKQYPPLTDEADIAKQKNMGKWFGIIFGAEGLLIFLAVNLVTNTGHIDLVIPVIALVVGLHFFPLAKVFDRTVDYYIATWATLVAICAILLTLQKTLTPNAAAVFTGIGIALATTAYGVYMMVAGRSLVKP